MCAQPLLPGCLLCPCHRVPGVPGLLGCRRTACRYQVGADTPLAQVRTGGPRVHSGPLAVSASLGIWYPLLLCRPWGSCFHDVFPQSFVRTPWFMAFSPTMTDLRPTGQGPKVTRIRHQDYQVLGVYKNPTNILVQACFPKENEKEKEKMPNSI